MFGHNSPAAELFSIRLFSGIFGKKCLNARGFAQEYLRFCSGYGPGQHQLLGGSISLKFLLETKLQSESFDTLDDPLGFRVKKL